MNYDIICDILHIKYECDGTTYAIDKLINEWISHDMNLSVWIIKSWDKVSLLYAFLKKNRIVLMQKNKGYIGPNIYI